MKKALAAIVVSFSLTGCVALDVAHLAYQSADQRTVVKSDQLIEPIEGKKVYAAKFSGRPMIWQKKCNTRGVVVDYVRDWDVIDENTGQVVFKADPTKIHEQVILMYNLTCKGESKQKVLLFDERHQVFRKPVKLWLNEEIRGSDYFKLHDSIKPRWMEQVIKTIQEEAPINPAAQDFLDNVEIGEDGLPVKPETSEDTPKE